MIETEELTKCYGSFTAVDRLTLNVERGEIFCLLGPNGAGKTTTIRLLLGLEQPDAGRARIAGLDVVGQSDAVRQQTAYIPESVALYEELSGLENLKYFDGLARNVEKRSHAAYEEILLQSGLAAEALRRRAGTYSKGMRQKVGIALARCRGASALLLDEPTSGLDPSASNEFIDLLRLLQRDGVATLIATHDLFRAQQVGSRVGIMRGGRLVETLRAGEMTHDDLEALYLEAARAS